MPVFIIGDIHGHYDRLCDLLRTAGLIGADYAWRGADATLCCVGDYVNHGRDGWRVLDLLMGLQPQIEQAGGRLITLIGNHDAILLAARRLGDTPSPYLNRSFYEAWRGVGSADDWQHITPAHEAWLNACPALVLLENRLIMHADAAFYLHYGTSFAEVNARFAAIRYSSDVLAWANWLKGFSEHHAFYRAGGTELAREFLQRFGGIQLIHGHSTIKTTLGEPDEQPSHAPYVYANGLVMNVDGGDATGAPGFIYAWDA